MELTADGCTDVGCSFSVTCNVTDTINGVTPTVIWLDPSGQELPNSDVSIDGPNVNGPTTILVLRFNPLRASQEGDYTCRAEIAVSETETVVETQIQPINPGIVGCIIFKPTQMQPIGYCNYFHLSLYKFSPLGHVLYLLSILHNFRPLVQIGYTIFPFTSLFAEASLSTSGPKNNHLPTKLLALHNTPIACYNHVSLFNPYSDI